MSAPSLMVHKLWTEYKPDPNDGGKLIEIDFVAYGPISGINRSVNVSKISTLSALQPLEGSQNPAVIMAHERWNAIKPHYTAWKEGREAPIEGTPLAAWNALTPEQAELFRSRGIKTVEAFAAMTDSTMSHVQLPGLRDLVRQANVFLESADQARMSAKILEKESQIDALKSEADEQKAQIAELLKKIDALAGMVAAKESDDEDGDEPAAPRPRGRPRKTVDQAAA